MNRFSLKTSVCFIIFNRPDTTQKVFNAIREAKPPKLLVIADGARIDKEGEAELCKQTRAIINQVDWDCEVLVNYSDVNLGCRKRITTGLNWLFEQVEEAIILEDDCLPHPTFFRFCEEILNKYRQESKIMTVSGQNLQLGQKRRNYSYYFSRYNHCWGWATWRRAWQLNDDEMKSWPKFKEENWLYDVLQDEYITKHWTSVFQSMYQGYDTWDYPWLFNIWLNQGLTVLPNINLVSNIGFGESATRTKNSGSILANMPVEEMEFPLKHPPFIIRETLADTFTERTFYSGNPPQPKIINIKDILYHALGCLNQPRNKIDLSTVTLVAVSSIDIEMTLLSLAISSLNINFHKILFFTSETVEIQYQKLFPKLEIIKIDPLRNLIDYSKFIIKELNSYIESEYCLITQGDGFIVNPHFWCDDFLNYDYIGAPWPQTLNLKNKQGEITEILDMQKNRVGNGGFSLRSKKLLNESSCLDFENISTSSKSEDLVICHYYYEWFKEKNIKFAPLEIAKKFSFEQPINEYLNISWRDTFGFHGKYSLNQVLIEISNKNSSIYDPILVFQLSEINYLIFPDWQSNEETLTEELYNLISKLAHNSPLTRGGWGGSNLPSPSGRGVGGEGIITLVIDTTGITEENANLILSGIAMNLMMEEELDLENILNFTLISNLNQQNWSKLLTQITAKVNLKNENQEIINQLNLEDLVTINGDGNNYVIFPNWKADHEELALEISQVLMNLSDMENCTLLVNLNNVDQEEIGLFFSEIAMNLMLTEGIELSDNLRINFVNFTANQWQSLGGLIKKKITINHEDLPENLLI